MNPMIQSPAVAVERPLLPDIEHDTPAIRPDRVYVVYTSIEQTLTAVTRLRSESIDLCVREYLCRDRRSAVPLAFKPHSLIVVAGRQRLWRTQEDFWRRTLEAAGHFVVFIKTAELKEHSHA